MRWEYHYHTFTRHLITHSHAQILVLLCTAKLLHRMIVKTKMAAHLPTSILLGSPPWAQGTQNREELRARLTAALDRIVKRVLDGYLGGEGQQALPPDSPRGSLTRNGEPVRSIHPQLGKTVEEVATNHRTAVRKISRHRNGLLLDHEVKQPSHLTFEHLGAVGATQGGRLTFERLSGDRVQAARKDAQEANRHRWEEEEDLTYWA